MDFLLVEEKGFEQGASCRFSDKATIGRDSTNNFQVLDNNASRMHAQVTVQEDNSIIIEDLNSANGTFVNEKKIKKEPICCNDKVRIGNTILVIKQASGQNGESQLQPFTISSNATRASTEIGNLKCSSCHQGVGSKWQFCPYCGTKLT